ncbi:MAG: glycosyltransferase [Cyanobacteria bacterium SID2]|nr:glycosyltransferase [Cyanobacteria bacterium SID2]MBP0005706.1 glycosyltransferase [Cyanobacteria bacterium SBC]
MKPYKVCLTTLEYPPDVGGVGESVSRIARMLLELGYDVHVAVFHSKQRKEGEFKRGRTQTTVRDGIYVHRLQPAIRSSEPIMQDYLSEIYFQLDRLHQQIGFDLFHGFFINETGFLTTLLARECDVPVINSVRGSDLHKHLFNPKQHGQIVWTLENSNWVTFVSRDLQARANVLVPGLTSKSVAFWNSIAPVDFDRLPAPPEIDRLQGLVIGAVGRFRDKKGLEFLLDACAELQTELALTLLLVGDFAERERQYWQQEIENSGMLDRTIVTGLLARQQALAYLPYIDVMAIPSLHDGCPNALLEAMLASRAIVGTRVDAIGEILEDGTDGLLVSPGSSQELTQAVRQLARSPQQRQKLGHAARSKALQQLSPQVEQSNWRKVYERVLPTSQLSVAAIA